MGDWSIMRSNGVVIVKKVRPPKHVATVGDSKTGCSGASAKRAWCLSSRIYSARKISWICNEVALLRRQTLQ